MTSGIEWSGSTGDAWAQEWQRTDRSFAELTSHLQAAMLEVAPSSGQAVDIGCGAGEVSFLLADARPTLTVTGLDISPDLVAVAEQRCSGRANAAFREGDAVLLVEALAPVDLYVSRHGIMFFDDPVAAFARFNAAGAEGAPLLFSCFRDWSLNGFACELAAALGGSEPPAGAPGPFAFADRDYVRAILRSAGWRDIDAVAVDFAYRAGEGADPVADAVALLRRIGPAARLLATLSDADKAAATERIATVAEQHRVGSAVDFPAAAWIWSARASGPSRH